MGITSFREWKSRSLALGAWLLALSVLMPQLAVGHPGHQHGVPAQDGRLPGIGDFKRAGDTTYRYLPERGEYEVSRPGRPTAFLHGDPAPPQPSLLADPGGFYPLPTSELAPICRTSGNRIVVVSTHRPGQFKDRTSEIRQIIKRMNWKIADQSSRASEGTRIVRMVVDCNEAGEIAVRYLETPTKEETAVVKAPRDAYGEPKGTNAVKYLIFEQSATSGVGGYAEASYDPNPVRTQSTLATVTFSAAVTEPVWSRHTPIHELFHTLGAVNPQAPFGNMGHCDDGIDIMCYQQSFGKYTETRCPSPEYNSALMAPIDCGNDTYFDPTPVPETWLAKNWNLGHWQNPFLLAKPAVTAEAATNVYGSTAKLRSSVHPEGVSTTYGFEWASDAEFKANGYTHATTGGKLAYDAGSVAVSEQLSGLASQTTYHYRVVAESEAGKTFGEDRQFTTTKAPILATGNAALSGGTSVTLNGTVNPNGLEASYQFEYDTKPYGAGEAPHGTAVPASPKALGSGEAALPVSETVSNLAFETTYHYRVAAVSLGGVRYYGASGSFTTPDADPPRVEAEAVPARLRVEQTVPKGFQVKIGGLVAKCQSLAFPVTRVHEGGTRNVYLDPEPGSCEFGGFSATINPQSCHFVLHAGGLGPAYGGALEVECVNPADGIEFKATTCTAFVREQEGSGGVGLTTEGSGSARFVKASFATTGLAYEIANDGIGCPFQGKGSFSDGTVSGELKLSGESDSSQAVGLFMQGSEGRAVGYYMQGAASENEALQPRFTGESGALRVGARQRPFEEVKFVAGSVALRCGLVRLDGVQAGASAAVLALDPRFGECTLGGLGGTVDPNSCRFDLTASNSGPPYAGTMAIACVEPNDAIEVVAGTCRLDIVPQAGAAGVALGNRGQGLERRIAMDLAVGGLTYQVKQDGIGCPLSGTGTFAAGALNGGMLMEAKKLSEVGIYLAGKQSNLESEKPRIESEYVPVDVAARIASGDQLAFGLKFNVTCAPGDVDLAGELTAAGPGLGLSSAPTSCGTATVDLNSCRYVLHVANSGPPYSGSLEVDCAEPGDRIEIASGTCKAGIPDQERTGVTLTTEGSWEKRRIALSLAVQGLSYQVIQDGVGCPLPPEGVLQDGTLTGDLTLTASA